MSRKWNLFARELEAILATRGLRLGQLDDLAAIHPERVRRLQKSLREPRFHTLPPENLEDICVLFELTSAEVARLKAAILATAIEQKLMDRINQDDALIAAEQLLPLLNSAILAHDGETVGIGQIKGGNSLQVTALLTPREQFEGALKQLDSAFISLNLASQVQGVSRAGWAHDAEMNFRLAIQSLELLDDDLCATDVWRVWHDEAQRGLQLVEDMLA